MKATGHVTVIACLIIVMFGALSAHTGTISYTYDAKGRITRADYGTDKSIAYTYDATGNIKSKTVFPYGTSNPATLIIASGYVKDRFSSPISGVTVNAYTLSPWNLVDTQTSGLSGGFSMSIPTNTNVVLEFISANYRTAYSQDIKLTPAATNLDVFTLMSTADYGALSWTLATDKTFLRGKVIDKQGAALSNVSITATAPYTAQYVQQVPFGTLIPFGQTTSNGIFVIPSLSPADSITITASSGIKTFNSPVFSHKAADTDSLGLVYDTTPVMPGGISGRLVNQYNLPFKDVMVRYYASPSYTVPSFGAQSDVNGDYSITNLAAGNYKLEFIGGFGSGCASTFFYNGKADKATADPIVVASTPLNGINAILTCTSSTNTVTIVADPPAGGKVVSPQGINCPANCSTQVPTGVSMPLTATAAAGYQFVNWTGTNGFITTTTNPMTAANITSSMTITANFVAATTYPLTLSLTGGTGGGNVNGTFTCNSDQVCSPQNFIEGASISLAAIPYANSQFAGWSGGCTNIIGNCNFLMTTAPGSITANFNLDKVRINALYYTTVQAAFAAIPTGGIIESRTMAFTDDIVFDSPAVSMKFKGGLEPDFTTASDFTTIHSLKIRNGKVIVDRLKLK